jgi:uncharacterized membrane protein
MQRVDSHNAVETCPAPEEAEVGFNGFFSTGDAEGGVNGTVVPAWWLNEVQESLVAVVLAGGQALGKAQYDSLLAAIRNVVENHPAVTDAVGKADTAFNDAAAALTQANSAAANASSALATAGTAKTTADSALADSGTALAQANVAVASSKIAMGEYQTFAGDFDADSVFVDGVRVHLTEGAAGQNLPVARPCFFDNAYDSAKTVSLQHCNPESGSPEYVRTGQIVDGAAAFGPWDTLTPGIAPTVFRTSLVATADIAAGGSLDVPAYIMGSNTLQVFWDGLLARPGAGNQYLEATNTTITLVSGAPAGTEFDFIVQGGQ